VKEIVYKPVSGGAACRKMGSRDWEPARLKLLHSAPVLFQEYIEGDNVRVYAIGDRIISSGIIRSEELDYRGSEESIEKIKLPGAVARICLKAMKLCGMQFTGMDLKIKPDGEFIFIECNPSPMFIGFQAYTGDPIDEYLADYLLEPVKGK
jgi:glutathione synthase/RimK-type ligase-like ATP-grasp enzyme